MSVCLKILDPWPVFASALSLLQSAFALECSAEATLEVQTSLSAMPPKKPRQGQQVERCEQCGQSNNVVAVCVSWKDVAFKIARDSQSLILIVCIAVCPGTDMAESATQGGPCLFHVPAQKLERYRERDRERERERETKKKEREKERQIDRKNEKKSQDKTANKKEREGDSSAELH